MEGAGGAEYVSLPWPRPQGHFRVSSEHRGSPEVSLVAGIGACRKQGCVLGGERKAGRRRVERSLAGRCAAATADANSAEAL